MTVHWIVQDIGSQAASGSWTDSVYLSSDNTLSSDALLIGRVTESGPLAAAASYTGTLTAPLPGALPGPYYVIVVADSTLLLPDLNRTNNVAVSTAPIEVTVPALSLSPSGGNPAPVTGTLSAGQDAFYQLLLPQESAVQINLSTSSPGGAELFEGYQYVPGSGNFDQHAYNATSSQQQVLLASPQTGSTTSASRATDRPSRTV